MTELTRGSFTTINGIRYEYDGFGTWYGGGRGGLIDVKGDRFKGLYTGRMFKTMLKAADAEQQFLLNRYQKAKAIVNEYEKAQKADLAATLERNKGAF